MKIPVAQIVACGGKRNEGVDEMDEKKLIDDIVAQLDASMAGGTGHINIDVKEGSEQKSVETMGCADCNKNPMACSIPTMLTDSDEE